MSTATRYRLGCHVRFRPPGLWAAMAIVASLVLGLTLFAVGCKKSDTASPSDATAAAPAPAPAPTPLPVPAPAPAPALAPTLAPQAAVAPGMINVEEFKSFAQHLAEAFSHGEIDAQFPELKAKTTFDLRDVDVLKTESVLHPYLAVCRIKESTKAPNLLVDSTITFSFYREAGGWVLSKAVSREDFNSGDNQSRIGQAQEIDFANVKWISDGVADANRR